MTTATRKPAGSHRPSLRTERQLQRDGYAVLIGMDEVGRGALAGPVSVGVVALDVTSRSAPYGVKDSKLLTPSARVAMVPKIKRWALGWGVGHASPEEIDQWGIMTGLRLAGERALAACGVVPDLILLDGNHDWLTRPDRVGLLAFAEPQTAHSSPVPAQAPVRTMIKADMRCSSVAAASVVAKVARDSMMVDLHDSHPQYGWNLNKGYAAPEHREALRAGGPCDHHRRSWNLMQATQEVDPR
ncbi:MAG: ribonuclease HII [Ornithinimicrobium sp.]